MTPSQIDTVESITLGLSGGVAIVFPPAAPFVAILKQLVETANELGIVPHELPAEQAASIAAGMAAARASAVATYVAHRGQK